VTPVRKLVAALALAAAAMLVPPAEAAQLSRLVPQPDGRINFGFKYRLFDSADPVWGDTRPFAERIQDSIQHELAGKTPTFITVWAAWQNPNAPGKPLVPFGLARNEIELVRKVIGEQGLLNLEWNLALSSKENGGLTVRDIREGAVDAYIRTFARDLRNYGEPALITPFVAEFNGAWWWAVSPDMNPDLKTDDFVQAWRRVVDIFRAVGASNVSWAWIVNNYPQQTDEPVIAYYPGDDYVDWIGADIYDTSPLHWLNGPYNMAVAHKKPFVLGEFGIRHEFSTLAPWQQQNWLEGIFDYFETHQAIKLISYFNYNYRAAAATVKWDPARDVYLDGGKVRYVPNFNDLDSRLLAGGPETQALFARRISEPRYVSAIGTQTVESHPEAATAELLPPTIRRTGATLGWLGNLAADSYDVSIKRRDGRWRTVASRIAARTYRLKGAARERLTVRVRARNVDGTAGRWTPARAIVFR
jgi:hypothetical protein